MPRLSPRTRLARKNSINPALRLLQSFTFGKWKRAKRMLPKDGQSGRDGWMLITQ